MLLEPVLLTDSGEPVLGFRRCIDEQEAAELSHVPAGGPALEIVFCAKGCCLLCAWYKRLG